MARPMSPIMLAHKANHGAGKRYFAVLINLFSGSVLAYAEAAITVNSVNNDGTSEALPLPIIYDAKIVKQPDVTFVDGRAPDVSEIELDNMDNFFGAIVGSGTNAFVGAEIAIYYCFEKPDGTFEADPYFIGKITQAPSEDETVRLNIVSDISDRAATVALILGQRCIAVFGDERCRYPKLPGQTCSKIYDDADNGCLHYRWQFSFVGVPFLAILSANSGGTFTGSGGHGCPRVDQYIWKIYRRRDERIAQATRADLIKPLDDLYCPFNQKIVTVQAAEIVVMPCIRVVSERGLSLVASTSQPMIRNQFDEEGLALALMRYGNPISTGLDSGLRRLDKVASLTPLGDFRCVKIRTTAPWIYLAGESEEGGFDLHNVKPIVPIEY